MKLSKQDCLQDPWKAISYHPQGSHAGFKSLETPRVKSLSLQAENLWFLVEEKNSDFCRGVILPSLKSRLLLLRNLSTLATGEILDEVFLCNPEKVSLKSKFFLHACPHPKIQMRDEAGEL